MPYRAELNQLIEKARKNPEHILAMQVVYQVNLEDQPPFQIRFQNGTVDLVEGTPHEADCTLLLSPANFTKLLRGEMDPAIAFMVGSLKVNGRMGFALKLKEVLKKYR